MRYDVYAALSTSGQWVALVFDTQKGDRILNTARALAYRDHVVFFSSFNDLLKWIKGAHQAQFVDLYIENGVDTFDFDALNLKKIDSSSFVEPRHSAETDAS